MDSLEEALRRDIMSGLLAPEGRLPAERQMIETYSTTRITLRQALQRIEIDGLIYRENRRGWFIAGPRMIYDPLRHSNFHEMAREQGFEPRTELISAGSATAPPEISQLLGGGPDTEYWKIVRRRQLDGRLVLYVEHYLSREVFPDILEHDLTRSLSDMYLEIYGVGYGSAFFEINPVALRGAQARELNCADGAYGLQIIRLNRDQNGRIIDCDVEFWRHQSISVKVEAGP